MTSNTCPMRSFSIIHFDIPVAHHIVFTCDTMAINCCSVISLRMRTYWIILILTLISTLIPTLNVPIYKFKYQRISYHYANHYLLDHYADYHLFYHYADHHMGTPFNF